ncbi:Aminomethyltransferase [Hyella patelloides LEGE 07179]|uniref:Aminomethyltransferase n=1 Tax=Hyella patelloides LEGE 07179 TaxID=945734 RepID=A0A563VTB7_9CYAN|nr:glycine cleavage system aminomethyltransferase GcvT [Hyella patelloides]VEP14687.1 Aminomethyltransferase [Hyella patelloides LEGE 07179]
MAESAKTPLLKTPLYDLALAQKARFVPFSGWSMPVQFAGLKQEHQAVRSNVGMFDISHMGKFALQGKDLITQLQKLVPSDLARLNKGQAQYTVLLNPQGGIIDDIIFYHQGETATGEIEGFLIVNAATKDKDKAWILNHLTDSEIQFQDLSGDRVLMAVQGSKAVEILQPLVADNISDLPAFGHTKTTIDGKAAFIARTGYTGEDGLEIMVEPSVGQELWQSLLAAGVTPCGLGARDTLRLEAAMCLYGQDIDDTTSPLEAGLGWLVHLQDKEDFIGKEVLEKQKSEGLSRRLVGLEMQGKHIARHDYPIMVAGEQVGIVTSGTLAPTLGKAIALGYVPKSLSKVGQELEIAIRGKTYPAKVVKKPFYRRTR